MAIIHTIGRVEFRNSTDEAWRPLPGGTSFTWAPELSTTAPDMPLFKPLSFSLTVPLRKTCALHRFLRDQALSSRRNGRRAHRKAMKRGRK